MEIDWTSLHSTWVAALLLRETLRRLTNLRIDVVLGTLLYGVALILIRTARYLISASKRLSGLRKQVPEVKRLIRPTSVLDFNTAYRLSGTEVVLGHGKRPIRVDLDQDHTLIAGTTGSGKTIAINSIMVQLVTRPEYGMLYDLYIVDLKGDVQDHLQKWSPVIAGYYAISEDGSTEQAIAAVESILNAMAASDGTRRIGVIIDELAMLTEQAPNAAVQRRGRAALTRLTSQLRSKGFLIAATQRPHYQTIPRNISSNLGRKVCFRCDDPETARLVLRTPKNPKEPISTFEDGQFLLSHNGKKRIGRTTLVLPKEIDSAVDQRIDLDAESDIRLKLFRFICEGLQKYGQLPGINRVTKEFDGLHSKQVEAYYRNFSLAGGILPIMSNMGQCKGYKLADDFSLSMSMVKSFIGAGKWQENPPPIKEAEKRYGVVRSDFK